MQRRSSPSCVGSWLRSTPCRPGSEVVDLVVAGRTNREIADRLVLSERTIESHVRSALMKRGCRNRAELIRAESADARPLA